MALSFDIRLTWEQFWDNQQNNPNCEMAFLYEGKVYYLYYETYQKRAWGIYESGIDPECCGRESFGKCLVENYDELQKHHRYPTDEEWKSSMNSCYKVLTAPIWNGISFKDAIEILLSNLNFINRGDPNRSPFVYQKTARKGGFINIRTTR